MDITTDHHVLWSWGPLKLNMTLVYTWVVMAILVLGSWLVTRDLHSERRTRQRHLLETIVGTIRDQVGEIADQDPRPFLPFIATLFLFISVSNLLGFVPGYHPPTGSLSTTAALAVAVFCAVPAYSIAQKGLLGYLRHYAEPTVLMTPFHVLGDFSRTIALAIRLFGNVMSGSLAVAVLLAIAPLFFPILMQALELLIGQVQAYIFAVLATVYIASAARVHQRHDRAPGAAPAGPAPPQQATRNGGNAHG